MVKRTPNPTPDTAGDVLDQAAAVVAAVDPTPEPPRTVESLTAAEKGEAFALTAAEAAEQLTQLSSFRAFMAQAGDETFRASRDAALQQEPLTGWRKACERAAELEPALVVVRDSGGEEPYSRRLLRDAAAELMSAPADVFLEEVAGLLRFGVEAFYMASVLRLKAYPGPNQRVGVDHFEVVPLDLATQVPALPTSPLLKKPRSSGTAAATAQEGGTSVRVTRPRITIMPAVEKYEEYRKKAAEAGMTVADWVMAQIG